MNASEMSYKMSYEDTNGGTKYTTDESKAQAEAMDTALERTELYVETIG